MLLQHTLAKHEPSLRITHIDTCQFQPPSYQLAIEDFGTLSAFAQGQLGSGGNERERVSNAALLSIQSYRFKNQISFCVTILMEYLLLLVKKI